MERIQKFSEELFESINGQYKGETSYLHEVPTPKGTQWPERGTRSEEVGEVRSRTRLTGENGILSGDREC